MKTTALITPKRTQERHPHSKNQRRIINLRQRTRLRRFYFVSIKVRNSSKSTVESCGPGEASGWYWTQ